MCMYIKIFADSDKTFTEGGYAAKFTKVFTRKSFPLYGKLYVNSIIPTSERNNLIGQKDSGCVLLGGEMTV